MQKGLEVKPVAISKGDKFSISRNRPRGTTGPYLSCWIFLSSRIYSPGALNGSADWQKASLFLAWSVAWSQLLRDSWEGCGGFWDFCCWTWDFFVIHLRTGLWLPLSGNYSSFLTVQEGPLKILTSSKQTASPRTGPGGHISPRGQETRSSELWRRFVFTGYLLFQICGLTQKLSSQIGVGSVRSPSALTVTRILTGVRRYCKY